VRDKASPFHLPCAAGVRGGCQVSEFTISPFIGVAALKAWYDAIERIALSYAEKVGGGNVA
jgi:hypothetical protein